MPLKGQFKLIYFRMKTIIKNLKIWSERRFRERCIKYAIKSLQKNDSADFLQIIANRTYNYIKKGELT